MTHEMHPPVIIDVMLPFYGSKDLLHEAVDSVLAQDDPHWRLTVIDDVYPDPDAASWVADIADDRVRFVRNEANLGVSGNFQRSLDLAEADWLVIMGCDDRLLPRYVGRMREQIAAFGDLTYLQPQIRVIDDDGHPHRPLVDRVKARLRLDVREPTVVDSKALTESLLRGNWMYFPATCWRREAISGIGFAPEYEIVPDWWLQLQLLQSGARVLLDPEVTFEYRRHSRSASSTSARELFRFHEEKALLLSMRDITRKRGWTGARRAATWHVSSRLHALVILGEHLLRGRLRGSRALLTHAFTNRWPPGNWPTQPRN